MTATDTTLELLRERLAAAFDGGNDPLSLAVLRSVVESVPSYIAILTTEGRYLYVHRFAPGRGPAEIEDSSIYDFLEPDSVPVARECIEQVVSTRQPGSFHCRVPRSGPDEAAGHYELRVAPIVLDDALIALSVVATDTTAEQRTLSALRTSEETVALAVEATGMGIWSWDAVTNEVAWDDMMCRHFGLPAGEGVTTYEGYMEHVLPEDREDVARSVQRAMETGTYGDLLHRILVDGEVRWVLIKGRVIRDENDEPVGLRGGVFDVTDRRRVDLKMRERQRIESLGELAAGVAHNFNNMLTAIMGNLAPLAANVEPGLRHHVDAAMAASQAAARIVRDLSSLTRRQRSPVRRQVPLSDVVEQVVSIVRTSFPKQVRFEVDDRLAGGDAPRVELLGSDLEHALLNLCINARDAVLAAERTDPRVQMIVRRRPPRPEDTRRWVDITVRDNGVGMDEPTRARIFEPFFTTKDEQNGTGMGLFTAHKTVNEHGGLLEVQSSPGQGAVFSVLLPELPPNVT